MESREILPQTKERLGLPEAESRKDPCQRLGGSIWPCQHLDFRLLVSRTMREYISHCKLSLWYFVTVDLAN